MKSWEIYSEARKALKSSGMCAIYGNRSSRMIDYWAQDPELSADPKRNPIDRLFMLIHTLEEAGHRDVAKSALRLLADAINCNAVPLFEVINNRGMADCYKRTTGPSIKPANGTHIFY